MDKVHQVALHRLVREKADLIKDRLPAHPNHPFGRIAVAHIYHVLLSVFDVPAKDLPNSAFPLVEEVVQFCVDHAEDMSITRQIKHKYPSFAKPPAVTLDSFFE